MGARRLRGFDVLRGPDARRVEQEDIFAHHAPGARIHFEQDVEIGIVDGLIAGQPNVGLPVGALQHLRANRLQNTLIFDIRRTVYRGRGDAGLDRIDIIAGRDRKIDFGDERLAE